MRCGHAMAKAFGGTGDIAEWPILSHGRTRTQVGPIPGAVRSGIRRTPWPRVLALRKADLTAHGGLFAERTTSHARDSCGACNYGRLPRAHRRTGSDAAADRF